jgi:hypothetical protein
VATAYSTRFGKINLAAPQASYQVPPGHRAVARSVAYANNGTANTRLWVACAGTYVWNRSIPGAYDSGWAELRLTAYQYEFLELLGEYGDIRAQLDGFLFADTGSGLVAGTLPSLGDGQAEPPAQEARPK